jgi:hypothetical protein
LNRFFIGQNRAASFDYLIDALKRCAPSSRAAHSADRQP